MKNAEEEYNDESLNYCPNCGAELVELKKRCKNCGNVTKVEALFCPKCGSDISSGEEELVVVHKQKKENVNSIVNNDGTCELIEDKKSEGNKYLLNFNYWCFNVFRIITNLFS